VQSTTGLQVAPALVARHARLTVRNERGRDGEPLPSDIPAVAAVTAMPAISLLRQEAAPLAS
jgi:hypothetical protein